MISARETQRFVRLAALALMLGVFSAPPAVAAANEVRIGTTGAVSDAVLYIAAEKGFFAAENITPIFTEGEPTTLVGPLGMGQLDVSAGSPSAGLYNAAAHAINIKIVADKGSTPPGYNYLPLLIRKTLVDAGRFKTYKDLKGLKIALISNTVSTASTLNVALKRGGLSFNDAQEVSLSFPQMVTALANGAIDASITAEPVASVAIDKGFAVRFSDDTLYPNQQTAVLLYSEDFITKQRDVANRFMIAYVKAARFYNQALSNGHFSGPTAEQVINILIKDTHVKDRALYTKMTPSGINPDARVNKESLGKDLQFFKDQGYVKNEIVVKNLIDMSFVDNAVKTLGPYQKQP